MACSSRGTRRPASLGGAVRRGAGSLRGAGRRGGSAGSLGPGRRGCGEWRRCHRCGGVRAAERGSVGQATSRGLRDSVPALRGPSVGAEPWAEAGAGPPRRLAWEPVTGGGWGNTRAASAGPESPGVLNAVGFKV